MAKRGVIIANTGSPAAPTEEALCGYFEMFLTDPRIRSMSPIVWNVISGNDSFIYVPCLNDSDAHVNLLRSIISSN